MPAWTAIYPGPTLWHGDSLTHWLALRPGLQVLIAWVASGYRGWHDIPPSVTLWTGLEEYDPWDTGHRVEGLLLSDASYRECWDLAVAVANGRPPWR